MSFSSKFEKINLNIHGVRLPQFDIDDRHYERLGINPDVANNEFLSTLCRQGFKDLGLEDRPNKDEYLERVEYELSIFEELSLVDYVLLVWDVINYCKDNDIATGFGRGSCSGSLALYLIGVTGIDPIEHGLYFERFVSRSRAKKTEVDGVTYLDGSLLMDVDLDICYRRRVEVVEYLHEKFEGRTSKILTFNTLSGKLLMKEAAKVVGGKSEVEANRVSAMIPRIYGRVMDIAKTYDNVKEFKKWCDENREAYETALKLRGLIKNKGAHPSGYAVSYYPLDEICPTELTRDKEVVSSIDMNCLSKLSVKLDLLGLRSATVVDEVCKMVGIKLADIDLNDPFIYQNLQDLRAPYGLFQIEADTNFSVVQRVKPKCLSDLSVCLALARPGALDYTDLFADYVNKSELQSTHPLFDEVLKESGGIPVYQEQAMKMANIIGFNLDESELLRRCIGRKQRDEMALWEQRVYDKVKENNLDEEAGKVLWKVLNDSADYSFNKSHSLAYAALSAATIYLKFKYPQEFFLTLLKMSRFEPDSHECVTKISHELPLFDIELKPPHLIKSKMDFSIEGSGIRYGLVSIKGVSDKVISSIEEFRSDYQNKFELFESAKAAKVSIGVLSALIQAGALEGYGDSRSRVALEAQLYNLLTDREKRIVMLLREKYEDDLIKIVRDMASKKRNDKGEPHIKMSRFETIKKRYSMYLNIYEHNRQNEELANYWYEKKLLGYSYSSALKDIFSNDWSSLQTISEVAEEPEDSVVEYVGAVNEVRSGIAANAKKTRWLRLTVGDETGVISTMLFNNSIDVVKASNNGKLPEADSIVYVKGTRKGDSVFANVVSEQTHKIYLKLSDLKG